MKKIIVVGSIFAVAILVLASMPTINAYENVDLNIEEINDNLSIKELIYFILTLFIVSISFGVLMLDFFIHWYFE